ncbi:MAG: EamA family transporter RarD [Novosphingobium sp.]|nr:EamA family transporter RarD [Novosphingobium sp.]
MPYALAAYIFWGLFPVYLLFVKTVPPVELIGWRILFTVPVCLLIVTVRRQWPDLMHALLNPKVVGWLFVSALLIGSNWTLYLIAILSGHIYATSLGYYINPLINVLIGTFFLGERLSRWQWLAVGLAMVGVAILAAGALTTLWISVVLATSFAIYGVVRRTLPVGSLPGLTIEALVLTVPAVCIILYYAMGANGIALGRDTTVDVAVAFSGLATAIPLLLFAMAARRMDYSTLGFVQFIAPTTVFILGLTVFDEPLHPAQLWSFIFIWCAIAVFAWDLFKRRRSVKTATAA